MKKTLKILMYIMILLLVLFSGVMVYVLSTDFSGWKDKIEQELSESLERPVYIESFALSVGSETQFSLSGLVIEDHPTHSLKSMAIAQYDVGVRLFPLLFQNRIDITNFTLNGARLQLNLPDTPAQSTAAGNEAQASLDPKGDKKNSGEPSFDYLPIIRALSLSNLVVELFDANKDAPIQIIVTDAVLSSDNEQSDQFLTINGKADGHKIGLGGVLGSVDSFFDKDSPWFVELNGDLGPAELAVKGSIIEPLRLRQVDMRMLAGGQELLQMARLMGITIDQQLGSWQIGVHITGADKDNLALEKFNLSLGDLRDSSTSSQDIYGIGLVAAGRMSKLTPAGIADWDILLKLTQPAKLEALKNEMAKYMPELAAIPVLPQPIEISANLNGGLESGIRLSKLRAIYGALARPMLNLRGDIQNILTQTGINLNLALDIPNMVQLIPTLRALFPDLALPAGIEQLAPLTFTSMIEGDVKDRLRVHNMRLQLGESDLNGDIDLTLEGKKSKPDLRVRLVSNQIFMDDFKPLWSGDNADDNAGSNANADKGTAKGNQDQTESPQNNSAQPQEDPLALLKRFELDLLYRLLDLHMFNMTFDDLVLSASVQDGVAKLLPLTLHFGESEAELQLSADANQTPTKFDVGFETKGLNPAELPIEQLAGIDSNAQAGGLDSVVNFDFQGYDMPTILENLSGDADFTLSNMDIGGLQIGGKRLDQVISGTGGGLLSGFDLTNIGCMGSPLSIDKGKINIQDGFVGVNDALALMSGGYDLSSGDIDMKIQPEAANISLPLTITGNASAPKIGIAGTNGALSLGKTLFGEGEAGQSNWANKINELRQTLPSAHGCQSYLAQRINQPPPSTGNAPAAKAVDRLKEAVDEQLDDALGEQAEPVRKLLKGLFN
ncbi:MAG: AsmA family protein [Alphaproteobacteria bacterium]